MPAITKSKRVAPAAQRNSIKKFGKISKSKAASPAVKEALELLNSGKNIEAPKSNTLKRKTDAFQESEKVERIAEPPTTPRKKARRVQSSVTQTPTHGARSLLQAFSLTSSQSSNAAKDVKQFETPPPSSQEDEQSDLPHQLQELIDLHSCLLTALSLHYAHSGPLTPVDLQLLCPNIARVWRKRRVDVKDIQRLLPLQRLEGPNTVSKELLTLADYGHGKICIELADSDAQKTHKRPIDEEALNANFRRSLTKRWETSRRTRTPPSATDFIRSLALSPITTISSLFIAASHLSKGQTRLTELKAGAIKAQERSLHLSSGNKTSSTSLDQGAKNSFERSAALKSRIFARQQLQSAAPSPLSPEQIARRSALLRVTEVAYILESIALSGQKHRNDDAEDDPFKQVTRNTSFTMPTLVQSLQMSLRNPMSREEAGKCVHLLAELAPEWLSVNMVGNVVGVTARGHGVGRAILSRRVQEAMSKAC